jgi:HK97 family phage portal protein
MDIFGRKALNKRLEKLMETVKQVGDARLSLMMQNFNTQIFPHYRAIKEQMIFQTMDDVYSVVSRLATTGAMIPYYGETKEAEELNDNDRINLLLDQLTFELKEKMHLDLLISGELFLYKQRILGVNAGAKIMRLNPANVVVYVSDSFPYEVTGFMYQDASRGTSFEIPKEDMVYVRLTNPTVDADYEFRGLSPIKVLTSRITRLQAQMDVSVAQLQNGGLPGIVYDENPEFGIEEAGFHKNNFANYLNNSSNKSAPYIWGGKIGYVPIGSTLADMDLASLADIDFDKICNVYGVSSTWFNNKSAATESNVKEMIKQIYTNAILPNIMRIQDAINTQLVPDFNSQGIVMYDLSDVTELQEDMLQKANVYSAMPVIIPNEVREAMGWDRIDDPLMDMPLIKSGYQPIEDLRTIEDLEDDNPTNNSGVPEVNRQGNQQPPADGNLPA